jgi:predicted DNA-binding transcriptional regulator YafY
VRHLKLDRFLKAVALDEWFKPNPELDVERHLRESIGIFSASRSQRFKIKLTARGARWVTEDPWHPQQELKPQADGSVILTVPAAHDLEVIPRVLALGSEAELLAPASCRQALRETVRQMGEKYG